MSEFIDKLNRLARGELQPLGFTARQSAPGPRIQLVAMLGAEGAERFANHIAGADALLLRISKPGAGAEALQTVSQARLGIPCGGWLEAGSQEEAAQISKAGWDFVVFPAASTFVAKPEDDKIGRILAVETTIDDGLLRAVDELPVDAVLIPSGRKNQALTWLDLMLCRHFADLLTQPLLVTVSSGVKGGELEALWEAGVTGVVLEVEAGQSEDRLAKLRQETEALKFSSRRSRRTAAVVPRISQPTGRRAPEREEER